MQSSKIKLPIWPFSKSHFALTVKRGFALFIKMKNVKQCSPCLLPSTFTLTYLIMVLHLLLLHKVIYGYYPVLFVHSQGDYSLLVDRCDVLGVWCMKAVTPLFPVADTRTILHPTFQNRRINEVEISKPWALGYLNGTKLLPLIGEMINSRWLWFLQHLWAA